MARRRAGTLYVTDDLTLSPFRCANRPTTSERCPRIHYSVSSFRERWPYDVTATATVSEYQNTGRATVPLTVVTNWRELVQSESRNAKTNDCRVRPE
jgi:hypothetical protein